jgi:hypothetical protein
MSRLLAKGDTPDLIFYRRRTAETPAALVLEAPAARWEAVTQLPASWTEKEHDRTQLTTLAVPPNLRGKLARFEMIAASAHVEALTVRLRYTTGKTLHSEYLLKPYLHPQPTKEFFAMPIPANAEQCEVQMKFRARRNASISSASGRSLKTRRHSLQLRPGDRSAQHCRPRASPAPLGQVLRRSHS